MASVLDNVFKPRSIAVIGATGDPDKLGYWVTKGFVDMGICRNIYPVNPKPRPVLNLKPYINVKEIDKGGVDLAILVLPPSIVPSAIEDCVAKGVKAVIVFSSAIGEDGRTARDIVGFARKNGTRIIGPDSMGIYCPAGGLALFPNMPRESGDVAFVSHSGAMAYMASLYGTGRGIWFSKVVDCGNESDLTFTDFLEYLERDPATKIISGYIEGVQDGKRFLEVASRTSRQKPIVLIKAGVTPKSSEVVASHTGLLIGSPKAWDSLFRQAGLIRVESLDDLIDCVLMFEKLRPPKGNRLALISGTGGPLVMATDLCIKAGFKIPHLSTQTRKKIREFLPPYGTSDCNPVDLSIAAGVKVELYSQACEVLGHSDEVDILLMIHSGEWRGDEFAKYMAQAARGISTSLVIVLPGNPEKTAGAIKNLVDAGIPAFSSLERAVKHLSSFIVYGRYKG